MSTDETDRCPPLDANYRELRVPIVTNNPAAVVGVQALSDQCTEFAALVGPQAAAETLLCIALHMLKLNETPALVVGDIVDRQVELAYPGFLDVVSNDFLELASNDDEEGKEH
jgi:hypothetical protein